MTTYINNHIHTTFSFSPYTPAEAARAAAKAGLKDFQDEEWCIDSPDGKQLILTGARPIGGFYAAWSFLNRLGCYALTWDQDAIPQDADLVILGMPVWASHVTPPLLSFLKQEKDWLQNKVYLINTNLQ